LDKGKLTKRRIFDLYEAQNQAKRRKKEGEKKKEKCPGAKKNGTYEEGIQKIPLEGVTLKRSPSERENKKGNRC